MAMVACMSASIIATAQTANAPASTLPTVRETVTVLGAPEPVTEGESSRSVETIDIQQAPLLFSEPASALRTDSSVDVQQRGPMGLQADISIRGGAFGQTLVLLNGFRINDAETAHFNFDLPIPIGALAGMDVLHGAGSTLYGADALGGVIDVRTARPSQSELRLRAGVGSYGINQQAVTASYVRGPWSELLAGGRDFSTGFIPDRDYRSETLMNESRTTTRLGETDILLAGSDRFYGADQFYGPYPSTERTKEWFGGLTQQLGDRTTAQVAYRRHTDIFVLYRNNPAVYKNQHIDQSWQGTLRRRDDVGKHVHLYYGAEENTDQIFSNSLGLHGRNRTALYLDGDVRGERGTFSAGVREEILSGGRTVTAPMASGSYWLAKQRVKVRGSVGYGFRIPTYTDLNYKDPTHLPNPNLKPEHAWNYDGGVDWYATNRVALSLTGFTSQQYDAIDYVRPNSASPYQAQNLRNFRFTGIESSANIRFTAGSQVRLAWTRLFGAAAALDGLQSQYLFNYAVNNASAEWTAGVRQVSLRSRLGVTERYQQTPYATLDISAARNAGWWRPYLQMTNLANTGYAELAGIRNQGRAFVGGVEIVLHRR
jgi:iron complex outermembrane receptor protein